MAKKRGPGQPPKPASQRASVTVPTYVTPSQAAQLRAAAARQSISVAELLRRSLRYYCASLRGDPLAAPEVTL